MKPNPEALKANEELEMQGSANEHSEKGLESNIEEVDNRTTKHEIKSVTIERQIDKSHGLKESSDSSEEEEDFEDNKAIVYSFTFGDNTPVIIQKVGDKVIDKDPEEDNECTGQPVESKLVIDTDGKVSEINRTGKNKRNTMGGTEEHKNSTSNKTYEETISISDEVNDKEVKNGKIKNKEVKHEEIKNIKAKNEEVMNIEVKNEEVKNIGVKNEDVKEIKVKKEGNRKVLATFFGKK